jgi:O-antigen/teichoic acid export membrane protein
VALIGLGTQLLLSIDLWVLNTASAGVEPAEKGLYVAASNIARMPNVLAFVMTAVLVPSIARALADNERALARRSLKGAMRFLAVTLLPGCALVAANARETMALLFSADYAAGASLLQVLIFAQGIGFTLLMTFGNVLMAGGQAIRAAMATIAVLPLALVLNIVLVRWLGAEGAALAALGALGTGAIVTGVLVHRLIGPLLEPSVLLRALLATAIVTVAAQLIPGAGLGLLVEFAGLAALTALLLPLLGLVTLADLRPFLPMRLKTP